MKIKNIKKKRKKNDEKSEVDEVRECVIEIELLNEDANLKYNCAHLNRRIVCEGERNVLCLLVDVC